MKKRNKYTKIKLSSYGVLFVQVMILIFVFLPIIWGFRTSLSTSTYDIDIIPKAITFKNYIIVTGSESFRTALKNSLIYSIGTVCVLTPIILLAAYALARMKFVGKGIVRTLLLVIPLLPSVALLIPLSRELNKLGLLNTRLGIILLNVTFQSCFTCWMMHNFFVTLPVSVEEAAYLDGCSRLQSLLRIVLPNAITGIISVVVYSFISSWLSYLIPYMVASQTQYFSLPQALLFLQGQYGANYPQLTSAAMITLIPPLLFFCVFQKWFIKGLFGVSNEK